MLEQRRLSAVMFTDMVGHSKKVVADETRALALVDEHNALVAGHVEKHGGKVLRFVGDAAMAEFPSAISGVECALSVQRAFKARNRGKSEFEAILIRIGLHLGDILLRDGDLFGDGVNIAARLEPLAEPGGICVSRVIYDTVKRALKLNAVSLGAKDLKNIGEAVEVFKILLDETSASHHAESEIVRFDDPRMRTVVAPFWGSTPEENDEGRKMAALVVRALEKELRGEDMQILFEDKAAVKTVEEAAALGAAKKADAVIWGEVVSLYGEVEITPRLVWTKHCHFGATRVDALATSTADKGQIALRRAKADEVANAALYMAALHQLALGGWEKAVELFKIYLRMTPRPAVEPVRGEPALGAEAPKSYLHLSWCLIYLRRFDEALAVAHEGVERFPKDAALRSRLGLANLRTGQQESGLREYEEAARLDPGNAETLAQLASCYVQLGRCEEAVRAGEEAVARDPHNAWARLHLGAAYWAAGNLDGARKSAQEAVRLAPENNYFLGMFGQMFVTGTVAAMLRPEAAGKETAISCIEQAARAFAEANRLAPFEPYSPLLLTATEKLFASPFLPPEAMGASRAETAHRAPNAAREARAGFWAASVEKFLNGGIGEDALLSAAAREGNAHVRRVYETEARYYMGMARLAAGDREGALAHFRACTSEGTLEDQTARGILTMLAAKP